MSWEMMGNGWMNGIGFGMHGVGMLLFWGLLIWLAVALVRMIGQNTQPVNQPTDSALGILSTRYAKGELSREEFEEIRQTIS